MMNYHKDYIVQFRHMGRRYEAEVDVEFEKSEIDALSDSYIDTTVLSLYDIKEKKYIDHEKISEDMFFDIENAASEKINNEVIYGPGEE